MSSGLTVLTVVERGKESDLSAVSLECLACARRLADKSGGNCMALVLGNATELTVNELRHYELDAIHVVEDPLLEKYQCDYYVSAFEQACGRIDADLFLFGNTLTHLDLAPRVAFRLDLPLITDCVQIEIDDGEPIFAKPVFSGNVMAAYKPGSLPCLATLRRSAVEPASRLDEQTGEVIAHDVSIDASMAKTQVVEGGFEEGEGSGVDKADIVVAGGRGIGGPEGFELLRDLSERLGAAIGASRPPCDLGWVSCNAQVGQTGAIIAPSLYIAVGISGSMQHIAGMSRSKTVVAINKDPKATIFEMADYGVAGEFEEVIPALIDFLDKRGDSA